MKIISKLKSYVWKNRRKKKNQKNALLIKNKNITILSMNCTGGILYHDLNMRFMSPTINMYMQAEDFVNFCEKPDYYMSIIHMTECKDPSIIGNRKYPVAYLGDIKLFLVHYRSVEEAERKWNERKQRIQWDNIAVIATDRDGMNDKLKERFEKLPYKKVMFVHLPDQKHLSCFCIKGYESDSQVGIITEEHGWKGLRPIDQFDYVSFINS